MLGERFDYGIGVRFAQIVWKLRQKGAKGYGVAEIAEVLATGERRWCRVQRYSDICESRRLQSRFRFIDAGKIPRIGELAKMFGVLRKTPRMMRGMMEIL